MHYTDLEVLEIVERIGAFVPDNRIRHYSSAGKFNLSCPVCQEGNSGHRKQRLYVFQSRSTGMWRCRCYNGGCAISGSSHDPIWVLSSLNGQSKMSIVMDIVKNPLLAGQLKDKTYVSTRLELPEGSVRISKDTLGPMKGCRDWEMIQDICEYMSSRHILQAPFAPPMYIVSPEDWLSDNSKWRDRFIIPFNNVRRNLVYYQGRHVGDHKVKYHGSEQTGVRPFCGMDRIKPKQKIYVTEGPIDGFFIPNCISIGSAMFTSEEALELCGLFNITLKDIVFVPDNPWIDKTGRESMLKAINIGTSIHLWPESDLKDINDVVNLNGDPLCFGNPEEWADIVNGYDAIMKLKVRGLYEQPKEFKSFKERSDSNGEERGLLRKGFNC